MYTCRLWKLRKILQSLDMTESELSELCLWLRNEFESCLQPRVGGRNNWHYSVIQDSFIFQKIEFRPQFSVHLRCLVCTVQLRDMVFRRMMVWTLSCKLWPRVPWFKIAQARSYHTLCKRFGLVGETRQCLWGEVYENFLSVMFSEAKPDLHRSPPCKSFLRTALSWSTCFVRGFFPRHLFWQRLDQLKSKSTCKPLLPRCLEMPWISSQCLHIVKQAMVVICWSENTAKTRVSFLMFSLWVLAVSGGQVSRQAGETVEVVVPPDLSPGDPFQVQMVQDWTVSKCFKAMLELSGVLWECKHWHNMSIVKLTGCSSPLDSAWLHLIKTMNNILVCMCLKPTSTFKFSTFWHRWTTWECATTYMYRRTFKLVTPFMCPYLSLLN